MNFAQNISRHIPRHLSRHISRLPRPFDPALGQEALARMADLTGDLARLIIGTAGSSPYLKGLIEQEAAWLTGALDDGEAAVKGVFNDMRALPPDQLKPGLRQAKRRIALITALADLAGAWPLETVTSVLSDLGDLACDLAIKAEIAVLIRRGKLPGQTEDDVATAGGMTVLAMGKMGAHELNYSSDIDLICLFDETRYLPDDFHDARSALVRATRNMCTTLSERTKDGYVFRTDLRLRPDPSVTPVCLAMAAAESYYESLGRTWERAAYIKARAAAGDIKAGEGFLKVLTPFVWRRHLDFAAIQDAHDMRLRIREHKGTGGTRDVAGHDMKLGQGGIREIEFFTQTLQIIAGGRDADLRQRGTCDGLAALSAKGWVPGDVADALTSHYRAHREVEHRIQMVNDAQTHVLPQSPEGIARIACLMGLDPDQLTRDLSARLGEVHELTEGFFAPDAARLPDTDPVPDTLDQSIMAGWPAYPALRSTRAAQTFDRLKPDLLRRLAQAAQPGQALVAFDGFLSGLPAGVQLFALFEANPSLLELLIDIVATSPALATHLARNSAVFDAVIGGDFFADWPGAVALEEGLTALLAAEPDYEARLDAARRWAREWHFRVGVHHLRGLLNAASAGAQYSDLAGAVIRALMPVVEVQFALKHGAAPGRGAAVIAMGSLGAGRLNAMSDLDLIVIYDPGTSGDSDMSDGPRPLATRTYFARLTQALITALSAPMAQGRLYEVDMRLRPSGTQGPVATSLASFTTYQRDRAWVWEHLALTRARVVAGAPGLVADIEALRRDLLAHKRDIAPVLGEVANMRARLGEAKTPVSLWDAKTGPGRMLDIELIAQAGALLGGLAARDVGAGLQGAVASDWLSVADAEALRATYDLCWVVHGAMRLMSGKAIDTDEMGQGGIAFLGRVTGMDDIDQLQGRLARAYAQSDAIITGVLVTWAGAND
ncbi:MAG: glutamine-synthetase adenylyltransferase [Rhodobacteraceae bacterium]|nr:glutamine-synthetase adenylyltransferase [Paracoccaceae bacterium]